MVILQFNKLIRNKWIWGVFAVAISAFFAFDFLFTGDRDRSGEIRPAGRIGDVDVKADVIQGFIDEIEMQNRNQNRENELKRHEINRRAWERYAAMQVAKRIGLSATESQLRAAIRGMQPFQVNGVFDFRRYEELLRFQNLTTEGFEARCRADITLDNLARMVWENSIWASPMELDQMADDMTDKFTVRVARFTQKPEDAAKVKVDDAAIRKWYDKNVKALALPERVRIRYVRFDATKPEFQKKLVLTEDELRDRYDATIDRYTVKGTNGTETVKKFEEVRAQVDKDLRLIAAVQCYETNLQNRAYAEVKPEAGKANGKVSRLEQIAKEEGLKVETSDWFAISGEVNEGFMKYPTQILPGAKDFIKSVTYLDPESDDERYGIVSSDRAVWLIEKAEVSAAHTPKFEDAKKIIEPRVLRDARTDAFKARVEAIVKGGVAAVTATKDVSTNLTFSVMDMGAIRSIPDAGVIARTARSLRKGEISEFTSLGGSRALVVVCVDRVPGDPLNKMMVRDQGRRQLEMAGQMMSAEWMKWNLSRKGFKPEPGYAIVEESSGEAGE